MNSINVQKYHNGILIFEGEVIDNMMNGKGKLYNIDGSILYDGLFKNNMICGYGERYNNNIIFKGYTTGAIMTGDVYMDGNLLYQGI